MCLYANICLFGEEVCAKYMYPKRGGTAVHIAIHGVPHSKVGNINNNSSPSAIKLVVGSMQYQRCVTVANLKTAVSPLIRLILFVGRTALILVHVCIECFCHLFNQPHHTHMTGH
jgi:hypothetical protein